MNEQLINTLADVVGTAAPLLIAAQGELITERAGVVNINTAPAAVLACLPGLDQELAEAIVGYRKSTGFFSNIAWLLDVSGMDQSKFKQLAPRVCARSETFRIISEGKVTSSGATQRLESIVRIEPYDVLTLAYREAH